MTRFYVGVDVGTGSARAGVFDEQGRRVGMASKAIQMWKPEPDFVEQSSDDIWAACGDSVKRALAEGGVKAADVRGVGFDATCSLVLLDAADKPVAVSPTGKDEQNVIVWMDHRAMKETEEINATGDEVLKYVGGVISPEMETPKLLWLKRNLPKSFGRAARFFDLPDFLTYRATGVDSRSHCTTVCKWTYLGHENGGAGAWSKSYFERIGLGELLENGAQKIGAKVRPLGERVGSLTEKAAAELGLAAGTAVGVSIIDAHAGGIGLLGTSVGGAALTEADLEKRLALIGGTSSCHMAVSKEPRFVPGVWGPYFSAMLPGLWLTEGGQSATGALIDATVLGHVRGPELAARAKAEKKTVYDLLNARLEELAQAPGCRFPAELTQGLHVEPDHHGNRSPRADATLRGMVSGLTLSTDIDALARLYLATIQAVAYGTRHILEALNEQGYRIDTLLATGGDAKNPVFVREHADATGCRIVLPQEAEAVLLGSAILGAVAVGDQPSVLAGMGAMSRAGSVVEPGAGTVRAFHARKYRVFQAMYQHQLEYRSIMGQ
ncbi:MAG TPA: FGGY-family carbohydrate kinase [Polyangiaceae bacterium]|nr:FGGY-family carbohydrate kinase [Polyangiaceae bacterium]